MLTHLAFLATGLVFGFAAQFLVCLTTGYHVGMLFGGGERWKFLNIWKLR